MRGATTCEGQLVANFFLPKGAWRDYAHASSESPNQRRNHMRLVRIVFIALGVLLPVSWTMAKAADPAPAAEGDKKDKKAAKKAEPAPAAGDMKTDKTEKKTEKK